MKLPGANNHIPPIDAQLIAIVPPAPARAGPDDAVSGGAENISCCCAVGRLKWEQAAEQRDVVILQAIAAAQASVEQHTTLKLLELRVAYEQANSNMLLRLGGVMLCIIIIAIASARFLGIVY